MNQKIIHPHLKKQAHIKTSKLYLALYLFLLPMLATADVVSTLNDFLLYLTGPVGKVVATLAIVGVGFACFVLGKLPKSAVIAVVLGTGIIFGASTLLSILTG
jgi:type IV secretory pathway VirB2 component (pilin)